MTRRILDTDICEEGTVEVVKIGWLVDTGSSITILLLREYGRIPKSRRQGLELGTRTLYLTDGGPMRAEGQAAMTIGVGRFSVQHTVVVVDCSDEVILGVDVLSRGGARINLAATTVSLEGVEIPMKPVDTGMCHRVSLTRGVVVQAGHRNIVEGRIVGQADGGPWMVEPLGGTM